MQEAPINKNENGGFQIPQFTRSVGFPWRIMVFSIILFALAIFVYFGLKVGYEAYLNSRSEDLDKKIEALVKQVSEADQQKFISFYSQLINLQKILGEHAYVSKNFAFLEKYTIPSVFFVEAKISGSGKERQVELKGNADSPKALVDQLAVFDKAQEIKGKAILKQIGFEGQKVGFTISFGLKPEVIMKL